MPMKFDSAWTPTRQVSGDPTPTPAEMKAILEAMAGARFDAASAPHQISPWPAGARDPDVPLN
jgi:hypothetical protein